MIAPKYIPLVVKHVVRHPTRSLLTISGVATAMFLFYAVAAMQEGVQTATQVGNEDNVLVVYRQDRYCPFSSALPQDYTRAIGEIPGVRHVDPVKVVVGNCRASLDVITFRGVPADAFEHGTLTRARVVAGSLEDWKRRGDAALVGERLLARRNLKLGDLLEVAGITINIVGVIASDEPQDQNVAYTHLDFIQRMSTSGEGIVTQFNVLIDEPERMEEVAAAIDKHFYSAQDPTATWSEKAFVARAVTDIVEIVSFARWLGYGSLVAVFALVANAIALSVRDRVRDHAVLQTLGFHQGLIARLILSEGLLLSVIGGTVGLLAGLGVSHWGQFSLSVEGLSINIQAGTATLLMGLGLSLAIGVLASLAPAVRAARLAPVECFRAV